MVLGLASKIFSLSLACLVIGVNIYFVFQVMPDSGLDLLSAFKGQADLRVSRVVITVGLLKNVLFNSNIFMFYYFCFLLYFVIVFLLDILSLLSLFFKRY